MPHSELHSEEVVLTGQLRRQKIKFKVHKMPALVRLVQIFNIELLYHFKA